MKKQISILIIAILLFSIIVPAYAEELEPPIDNPVIEEFQGMRSVTASLEISGSTATCHSKLTGKSSYSYCLTMSLQKQNGSSWSTVVSWSETGAGINGINLTKVKSGLSSGIYRCKVSVSVYDSNNQQVESTTAYSTSLSC